EIFRAVEVQPVLVLGMSFSYLLAKRLLPRYAVLCALLVGCLIAGLSGLLDFQRFSLQVAAPVWTTPSLSFAAIFSIGIPLFVIAMASQNMPGLAVLRAEGYDAPASPLISVTGIASVLLAPFGSHGIHLAAITMAICAGPEAHPDRSKRYTAAVWRGLFAAFPAALVLSIAALALLGSIGSGLTQAMQTPHEREAALITFMVTASGLTLFGIGAALWGLIAGVVTLVILGRRD